MALRDQWRIVFFLAAGNLALFWHISVLRQQAVTSEAAAMDSVEGERTKGTLPDWAPATAPKNPVRHGIPGVGKGTLEPAAPPSRATPPAPEPGQRDGPWRQV